MDANSTSTLAMWGGWILTALIALIGTISASIGWLVRGKMAEFLAKKKDAHDAIDKAIKALADFEDCSISFWCEENSKSHEYHILVSHRRLVTAYKQISEFTEIMLPLHVLSDLRKTVTLDFESAARPISANDHRIKKLMNQVSTALDSDFLLKSWKSSITMKEIILSAFRKSH